MKECGTFLDGRTSQERGKHLLAIRNVHFLGGRGGGISNTVGWADLGIICDF